MTVIWFWETPGVKAHARRNDDAVALCGAGLAGPALMRPPFPAIRCEDCKAGVGGDTQVFPNKYLLM